MGKMDALSELSSNLVLQEYVSLKAEIRDLVTETGTLAKYSIVFTGAFVAFLLKEKNLKIPKVFNFLPTIFTALLALRSSIIGIHIGRLGEYIRLHVEPRFKNQNNFKDMGWENYYKDYQIGGINMSILGITFTAFWFINLLTCILIGYWLSKRKTYNRNSRANLK